MFSALSLPHSVDQNLSALTPSRRGTDEAICVLVVPDTDTAVKIGDAVADADPVSIACGPKRAHAFFHLHCVHHMSRCSSPNTLRHFLPPSRIRRIGDFIEDDDDIEEEGLRAGGLIRIILP